MSDAEKLNVKLGKLAPQRLMSAPAFGDFLDQTRTWPAVAARGWEYAVPVNDLEMLGNDQYGCCAEAGAMHLIQVATANSGEMLHGTEDQTLDLYSELTGFNKNDPSTDNGTVLLDVLRFWKKVGITVTDSRGNKVVHKILGWATLDTNSVAQYRYANDIFGGSYLGIQCPLSCMRDMTNWLYDPNSPIEGGHCINGTGQGRYGGHIQSWGKNIPFDWNFLLHTLDEAYIVLSEHWLNRQGKSPSGLDLNGLLNAMKQL